MVDASPNANACRLKNGSLSPPLFRLLGKVCFGLLVLAVIFLTLQKDGEPKRCTCHPLWNSNIIVLVRRNEIYEVTFFFFFSS